MLWGDQSFRLILIFNKRQVAWLVRQNGLFEARPLPTHFMRSIKTIEFQQTKLFTENTLMNDTITGPHDVIASAGSSNDSMPKPQNPAVLKRIVGPFSRYPLVKKAIAKRASKASSEIEVELAAVKRAWAKYRSTKGRDAVYIYLEAVFNVVRRWQRLNCAIKKSQAALRLQADPPRMKPEPFGIVIFCTSDPEIADAKTRSKWSRALRYARNAKRGNQRLTDFIKSIGGINECARHPRGTKSNEVPLTTASNLRSHFGMCCVQCSNELIAPERCEYWRDSPVRHVWHCPKCRCCFESRVKFLRQANNA
jgi:hypothetical protein